MRDIKTTLSREPPVPVAPPKQEQPIAVMPEPKLEEPLEEVEKEVPELKAPSFLATQFDDILKKLDNKTGIETSTALERFQSEYVKRKGYNSVLKNIHTTCNDLKNKTTLLTPPEKDKLTMTMKMWRQQLDL
ncbi:MAG: hypothetical protein ACFFFB_12215 [Candidatus Heimdallarchaeota archaeon]